jgi:hypothetical protein
MSAHQRVCTAVRDWQSGEATADDVTAVALEMADGDTDGARQLMRAAVEWWQGLQAYRDVNGQQISRRAA